MRDGVRRLLECSLAAAAGATLALWWLRDAPTGHHPGNRPETAPASAARSAPGQAAGEFESKPNDPRSGGENAAPATSPVAPVPAAGLSASVVFGLVSSADGRPIFDASLVLSARKVKAREVRSTTGGNYSFAGVGEGTFVLSCRANGYQETETEVTLESNPKFHRVDFALDSKIRIRIRFTSPDGTPIATALAPLGLKQGAFGNFTLFVLAGPQPIPRRLPQLLGRGHYRYFGSNYLDALSFVGKDRLPDGVSGILEVPKPPPFYVAPTIRNVAFESVLVKEPVEELTLVVDPAKITESLGSLRLQVVDADTNEPIAGSGANLGDRQTSGAHVDAGADGSVIFTNVTPGLLHLAVNGTRDYATSNRFVLMEPGEFKDVGRVALTKKAKITGTILDSQGNPVSCTIIAYPESRGPLTVPLDFGLHSNSRTDGSFEFVVGRGPYVLMIRSEDQCVGSVRVDTSRGSVDGIRCTMPSGPEVRIKILGDDPTAFRVLEIIDAAGVPVRSLQVGLGIQPVFRLSAGTYEYCVRTYDGPTSSGTLTVGTATAELTIKN